MRRQSPQSDAAPRSGWPVYNAGRGCWPVGARLLLRVDYAVCSVLIGIVWAGLVGKLAGELLAQENRSPTPEALLVKVPVPLTGDDDRRIIGQLEGFLNRVSPGPERPVCVLEFTPREDAQGEATQFERALALARFLSSERMNRVRTVAYLPHNLRGHVVLVALACEEIAVDDEMVFGPAAEPSEPLDATVREAYRSIAERRRTLPVPVAVALLDPAVDVYRVELLDGTVRFVTGEERATLRAAGTVSKEETIVGRGDVLQLTGRDMRLKYGFAAHLVNNRRELAGQLKLAPEALRDTVELSTDWQVVRVDVRGRIHAEPITRAIRLVQDRLQRAERFLLVVQLDSPGGSPGDSLRLAEFLASLASRQVRTCVFVHGAARCDAALIALGADDLLVAPDAVLGGPGERNLTARELSEIREPVRAIARAKNRDWSLWYGMVHPKEQVFRCNRQGTGEVRFFTKEERNEQPDPEAWQVGEPVKIADGLHANETLQFGLARATVENVNEIPALYGLSSNMELLQPGWFIMRLENLAAQAWFSRTLLFLAFFGLIIEASTPGVGVPGFLSAICFLLFFWAQFLNGTAAWLEVLLFLGGLGFLFVELFLLPGFGIFGIGGALMMIAALILAGQTFVIPENSYQMRQMPQSLYGVLMALLGTATGIYVMRRYLPNAPWLRNLVLQPPHEVVQDLDRRESLVDYSDLLGKQGVAITLLAPSGKARFGDRIVDVISDGTLARPGTQIRVVDVRGSQITVEVVEDSSSS
jgi:membrane-bound serine protease (ClpP class)